MSIRHVRGTAKYRIPQYRIPRFFELFEILNTAYRAFFNFLRFSIPHTAQISAVPRGTAVYRGNLYVKGCIILRYAVPHRVRYRAFSDILKNLDTAYRTFSMVCGAVPQPHFSEKVRYGTARYRAHVWLL